MKSQIKTKPKLDASKILSCSNPLSTVIIIETTQEVIVY